MFPNFITSHFLTSSFLTAMDEIEHKSFFRSRKALSILPLLLLSAGGLYYVFRHAPDGVSGPVPRDFDFGKPVPKPAAPPSPAAEEARNIAALDIQGSPEFKTQVTAALKLIWLSDRESFLFIKRYLYVIRNEDRTAFYLDSGMPVAAISRDHAFRSATWCAGIIAHQTYHSYISFGYKKAQKKSAAGPPPPGSADKAHIRPPMTFNYDLTGLDAILELEAKASGFQAGILEKVGAPQKELNEVLKRKPRDFKPGHDGHYDLLIKP